VCALLILTLSYLLKALAIEEEKKSGVQA